jgi:hypothetical protein
MPICCKTQKKLKKSFQKGLDNEVLPWYNVCAMKQNVPRSHPAASGAHGLIFFVVISHGCVVRSVPSRDFLFRQASLGIGGAFY